MSNPRGIALVLGAYLKGNPRVIGAREEKGPLAKLPTGYLAALSALVLFGIAGAAWWAWFVSRGLTVADAEGFRSVRLSEE
jgi:hypothetical protein